MAKFAKELAKKGSLAAIDTLVAGYDNVHYGGAPVVTGVWNAVKAFGEAGLALRPQRAQEFMELIGVHPEIFTEQLIRRTEFQDAFVLAIENYIRERNADKRAFLRAIFLDFSVAPNAESYPLERLNEITRQITLSEAKYFSRLVALSSEMPRGRALDTDVSHIELVTHLVSLGLLIQDDSPRYVTESSGVRAPRVYISGLGAKYLTFIRDSDIAAISS